MRRLIFLPTAKSDRLFESKSTFAEEKLIPNPLSLELMLAASITCKGSEIESKLIMKLNS